MIKPKEIRKQEIDLKGSQGNAFYIMGAGKNLHRDLTREGVELPPWEEIYVSDQERYENFEQAQLIHDHLVETYEKYGYELIEVPKDTLDKRILFILEQISN
jgi:predicted ATPase